MIILNILLDGFTVSSRKCSMTSKILSPNEIHHIGSSITSVNSYNDGQWHYAVVTNDGITLRLYVDGVEVATKALAGASPENTGNKPVRVGQIQELLLQETSLLVRLTKLGYGMMT